MAIAARPLTFLLATALLAGLACGQGVPAAATGQPAAPAHADATVEYIAGLIRVESFTVPIGRTVIATADTRIISTGPILIDGALLGLTPEPAAVGGSGASLVIESGHSITVSGRIRAGSGGRALADRAPGGTGGNLVLRAPRINLRDDLRGAAGGNGGGSGAGGDAGHIVIRGELALLGTGYPDRPGAPLWIIGGTGGKGGKGTTFPAPDAQLGNKNKAGKGGDGGAGGDVILGNGPALEAYPVRYPADPGPALLANIHWTVATAPAGKDGQSGSADAPPTDGMPGENFQFAAIGGKGGASGEGGDVAFDPFMGDTARRIRADTPFVYMGGDSGKGGLGGFTSAGHGGRGGRGGDAMLKEDGSAYLTPGGNGGPGGLGGFMVTGRGGDYSRGGLGWKGAIPKGMEQPKDGKSLAGAPGRGGYGGAGGQGGAGGHGTPDGRPGPDGDMKRTADTVRADQVTGQRIWELLDAMNTVEER